MVGGWSSSPSPSPSQQPCASCKLLRRRCVKECIFAPYFPPDDPLKFAIVHKVFGASNVSKMLQELPVHQRADAVSSLVYEADARNRDPVYGCVGAISCLQNQVSQLQLQLAAARAEILCMQMQMQQQRDQDQSTSFSMAITNMNTESVHGRMQQLIRSAQHASARGLHRLDRSASNNNVIVLEPAAAALN